MNIDHVFVDVAMSEAGKVNGIAAIRTDYRGNILSAFSESVTATQKARAARAQAVIDRLDDVILRGTELRDGVVYEPSFVVIAWNAAVDREVLHRFVDEETNLNHELFGTKAWIDPMQLAWPLVYHDMIADRSLESLCASFGFMVESNSATGECKALVKVYWELMRRYKAALAGEEIIRSVGGRPLETVRRIIGY